MSKGSYRGGSTITGWNAARYVSPGRIGRKTAGVKTAQSRTESAARDEAVRKRHGLKVVCTKMKKMTRKRKELLLKHHP